MTATKPLTAQKKTSPHFHPWNWFNLSISI